MEVPNAASIYVTLISNASLDTYPDNVISEFTTKLAHPLTLIGEWTVALHSCSYHRNWLNVNPNFDTRFTLHIADSNGHTHSVEALLSSPGNYLSVESVLRSLLQHKFFWHDKRHAIHDFCDLTFDDATQLVTLRYRDLTGTKHVSVAFSFSKDLARMLGAYDDSMGASMSVGLRHLTNMAAMTESLTFPRLAQLESVHNLFLYTDIVKASRLGDSDASFLYIVPVEGQPGDYVHHQVMHMLYKDVSTPYCTNIRIKVADVLGERVKFVHGSGEFTCVLHFRRVG